ncbi:hypothetical protein [Actinoallomurus sp. NPDC050550]|uniref:hypothetical protein n=1 Tax=Actinoallomurus sp. NPDC050550 TaxID=3154937 RepID=UPI00340D9BAF
MTNSRRTLAALVGSAAVATALAAGAPSTAWSRTVAQTSNTSAADCTTAVDIGLTVYDHHDEAAKGSGSWTRCGGSDFTRIVITLYEHRWWGWERVASLDLNPVDYGSGARSVVKGCEGTDPSTYKTVIQAFRRNGATWDTVARKESNIREMPCS